MITETECVRRVEHATKELQKALRKAEFRACVAEWAVAGIVAQKVSVTHALAQAATDQAWDIRGVEKAIGHQCAVALLRRAGLEFRNHAELAHLKHALTREFRPACATEDPVLEMQYAWPLPFGYSKD